MAIPEITEKPPEGFVLDAPPPPQGFLLDEPSPTLPASGPSVARVHDKVSGEDTLIAAVGEKKGPEGQSFFVRAWSSLVTGEPIGADDDYLLPADTPLGEGVTAGMVRAEENAKKAFEIAKNTGLSIEEAQIIQREREKPNLSDANKAAIEDVTRILLLRRMQKQIDALTDSARMGLGERGVKQTYNAFANVAKQVMRYGNVSMTGGSEPPSFPLSSDYGFPPTIVGESPPDLRTQEQRDFDNERAMWVATMIGGPVTRPQLDMFYKLVLTSEVKEQEARRLLHGMGSWKPKHPVPELAYATDTLVPFSYVPEAETFGENIVDATANIVAMMAELAILRKILPAGTPEWMVWEIQNNLSGGKPGHGALMYWTLAEVRKTFPGVEFKPSALRVLTTGGIFVGATATDPDATVEDLIIAAGIPVALELAGLTRNRFKESPQESREKLSKVLSEAIGREVTPDIMDRVLKEASTTLPTKPEQPKVEAMPPKASPEAPGAPRTGAEVAKAPEVKAGAEVAPEVKQGVSLVAPKAAAEVSEVKPKPPAPEEVQRVVALRNDILDAELKKAGVSLTKSTRPDPQMVEEAAREFASNPNVGKELISRYEGDPTIPLSVKERFILFHEKVDIARASDQLRKQIREAESRGDMIGADALRPRLQELQDQNTRLAKVAEESIADTASALRANQLMMAMDYSTTNQLTLYEIAKGRPPTEKEAAKITKDTERIVEIGSRLEELQKATGEPRKLPDKELLSEAQRLSKELVAKGVSERNALVDGVLAEIQKTRPDVTRQEVMDAVSGYGQFRPLNKEADAATLRDLKGQLQQVAKLEEMEAGQAPSKTGFERRTPSAEEARLIKLVDEAMKEGGYKTRADYIARVKKQIAELQDKLARGDYEKVPAKPSRELSEEEVKLKIERARLQFALDQRRKPPSERMYNIMQETGRLAKQLVMGADDSLALLQLYPTLAQDIGRGVVDLASGKQPKFVWGEAVGKSLKQFFSKEVDVYFDEQMSLLKKSEWHSFLVQQKLWVEFGSQASPSVRPESAMSRYTERIPLLDRSGMAAAIAQDTAMTRLAEIEGPKWKALGALKTPKDYRTLAKRIGDMAGRGPLPRGETVRVVAGISTDYITSTRLLTSQLRNFGTLFGTLSSNPASRAMGVRTLAGIATLVAAESYIGSLFGWETEWDPRSSDGIKMRKGNTRIELIPGYGWLARFVSRTAIRLIRGTTGAQISDTKAASGRMLQTDEMDEIWRLIRNRRAPLLSLAETAITQKDFMGRDIKGFEGWSEAAKDHFLFMWINDGIDVAKDELENEGLTKQALDSIAATGFSWFGGPIQTYPDTASTTLAKFGEGVAQKKYGKAWDDLTPKQQKELRDDEAYRPKFEELQHAVDVEGKTRTDFDWVGESIERSKAAGQEVKDRLSPESQKALEAASLSLSRTVRDWWMNDERFARYQALVVEELEARLSERTQSADYKEATDARKKAIAEGIAEAAKASAASRLIKEIEPEE